MPKCHLRSAPGALYLLADLLVDDTVVCSMEDPATGRAYHFAVYRRLLPLPMVRRACTQQRPPAGYVFVTPGPPVLPAP